jgi:hypothetical protein
MDGQVLLQEPGEAGVVFDDQNPWHILYTTSVGSIADRRPRTG